MSDWAVEAQNYTWYPPCLCSELRCSNALWATPRQRSLPARAVRPSSPCPSCCRGSRSGVHICTPQLYRMSDALTRRLAGSCLPGHTLPYMCALYVRPLYVYIICMPYLYDSQVSCHR
jgi:hypothetical protein